MKTIQYIPIDKLIPHPDNPRKDLGDLTELADSIREAGIYQNLTVVPALGDTYKIIIGHRRHAAARIAGLTELPCIVTDMDEETQLATMLLENMQRSDLTIIEQAHGMQMMLDIGYTPEEISKKTGFSRSTVSKRLTVASLPFEAAKEAEGRGGRLEDFAKLAQIKDEKCRNKVLAQIGTKDFDWYFNRAIEDQTIKERLPFVMGQLKELGAEEIKTSERHSSRYSCVCSVSISSPHFDKEAPLLQVKEYDCKKKLFYYLNNNQLYFYQKSEPNHKPKKSAAEKHADEVREQLKQKFTEIYELRKSFVDGFTAFTKYKDVIDKWHLYMSARYGGSYIVNAYQTVAELAGYKLYQASEEEAHPRILEWIKRPEAKFTVTMLLMNDSNTLNCISYSYGTELPRFRECPKLSLIYEVLEDLGYQPCTEEEQLLDGTHELYAKEKKK